MYILPVGYQDSPQKTVSVKSNKTASKPCIKPLTKFLTLGDKLVSKILQYEARLKELSIKRNECERNIQKLKAKYNHAEVSITEEARAADRFNISANAQEIIDIDFETVTLKFMLWVLKKAQYIVK